MRLDEYGVPAMAALKRVVFFDDLAVKSDAIVAVPLAPACRPIGVEGHSSTLACKPNVDA